MTPHHLQGTWLDIGSPLADFMPGDIRMLLIAVRLNDEFTSPEIVQGSLRAWNLSESDAMYVDVQLIGGLSRTIVREFKFRLLLRPNFEVSESVI